MLQIMSYRLHAVYDYLLSVFTVLMPWIFGFAGNPMAKWVTITFGIVYFLDTFFTGHRLSPFRFLHMYEHLGIDGTWGVLMAMAPWFFGFNLVVFWAHLIIGLCVPIVCLMTRIPVTEAD